MSASTGRAARANRTRTAAAPAAGAGARARIFQIHYRAAQTAALDPAFEPLDNAGNTDVLLEFGVFRRLALRADLREAPLWGALSWKFGQKTGMRGEDFRRQIDAHPGYDVYFCNPHTEVEALFHNLWMQGETAHPSFLALCREVFRAARLPENLLTEIQPSSEFAASNFFVATPCFWQHYIAFVERVLAAIDSGLPAASRAILYSSRADQGGLHGGATYIPFLVERLFAVFLRLDGARFRACKIAVGPRPDNAHLKLLGQMKDAACRSRSAWMAACWVNYRNLYLARLHGESWSRRYLRHITPAELVFAPPIHGLKDAR